MTYSWFDMPIIRRLGFRVPIALAAMWGAALTGLTGAVQAQSNPLVDAEIFAEGLLRLPLRTLGRGSGDGPSSPRVRRPKGFRC